MNDYPRQVRIAFAAVSLAFCFGVIAWVIAFGSSTNSLHQSALSWAFTLAMAVMGGIGFGAVVPYIPPLKMLKRSK